MPEAPLEKSKTAAARLDRRGFLKSIGGGLVVLLASDSETRAQESGSGGRAGTPKLPENVAAWLHISPDGTIEAFTGKVEVGQNIRTSLTQAVADELRCPASTVQLIMGDTARTPWDMGTFGSRTTPTMAPELRRMAATARETMIDQASKTWGIDRSQLQVENNCVCDKASGNKASFGDLAAKIDWVNVVGKADYVTPPNQWQVAGKSLPKINGKEM